MFDLNSPSLPHYLFLILVTNSDFIFRLGYFKKKQPVQKSIIRKEIFYVNGERIKICRSAKSIRRTLERAIISRNRLDRARDRPPVEREYSDGH